MNANQALGREWLVTNGLGGFASGTVALANTRRYHGLLIAALRPPLDRVLMVAKLDASVRYRGRRFDLATNEFADHTLAPRGFESLTEFRLEDATPVWTFTLADAVLEQRIWMANGRNTTYVAFSLLAACEPMELELLPLCTYRDYHSHTHGGWQLGTEDAVRACRVIAFDSARPYGLSVDRGEFVSARDWYWRFHHRAEAERGLDAEEDLFRPGVFRTRLAAGETVTFIATAESEEPASGRGALAQERKRQQARLRSVPNETPDWIRRLTLAADQFIVQRWRDGRPDGMTVIAGYPWFGDWGRDTMIALPGLTLTTGRADDAASILRTFAAHVSEGMLPNRFPDRGETPEYNTVDATLWYFHAIDAYLEATDDRGLLRDLYPVLRDIVQWHVRGTRYGIHVDEADGLLYSGEPGVQLTWMDAKIGDWVVTPRTGKCVEINSLWHFALTRMASWASLLGEKQDAAEYAMRAGHVSSSFADAFWYADGSYLFDVIDTPTDPAQDNTPRNSRGQPADASLRPNQIFAVSLGTDLLDASRSRAVVSTCAQHLLTPVGLRSLAPGDRRYAARYLGGPGERDAVYHQGTVWSWLLGAFALAHYRAYGDAAHALALLKGIAGHLNEACVGTVSEIFDGDAPHVPRGCVAQAWGVSETLRAWTTLTRIQSRAERSLVTRGFAP
ncbi:MAG TPA: amylo-alpha-1,6-glucosidase [Steroidobacteraceae bacterium]|nr:amylo-alpha-1,6-glucosidase [Steroidobacteraceae bacterium]